MQKPSFLFSPADWVMGKIQKCSLPTQASYIGLCCLYWTKDCDLSIQSSVDHIGEQSFAELVDKRVVKMDGQNIKIDFLYSQKIKVDEVIEKTKKETQTKSKKDKKPLDETEQGFLKMFNELRQHIRNNSKLNHRNLSDSARTNLKKILQSGYSEEEIKYTITAMLCADWPKRTGNDTPDHLLIEKNFVRYFGTENIKQVQNDSTPTKPTREDKWADGFNDLKEHFTEPTKSTDFTNDDNGIVECTTYSGGATYDDPPQDSDIWRELQS